MLRRALIFDMAADLLSSDPVALLRAGFDAAVAAADDADRIRRRQARQAWVSELAGPPAILHRGA